MTPEDHNKILGWGHIGYGAFFTLIGLVVGLFMFIIGAIARNDPHPPPPGLFEGIGIFIALLYGALAVPSIIAGYALLKRKSWAKIASIIAGVMSAISFPIGTAVCVYTFWFHFSEPGKLLYDNPQQQPWNAAQQPPDWRGATALNPPNANDWQAANWQERQPNQYAPPPPPPDWRK